MPARHQLQSIVDLRKVKFTGIDLRNAEYEPFRDQPRLAGLGEEELRKMDPDDQVAALEQANLVISPAEKKAIYNRRAAG